MWRKFKSMVPADWRVAIKRRLFVVQDMRARLVNLRRAGFIPTGAIDGGAYLGDWTSEFWAVWPSVPVLLVEPQPNCTARLARVAGRVCRSDVVPVALSNAVGNVHFRLGDSNSSICTDPDPSRGISVASTTLDHLLAERPSFVPNLLKLDLQGFELAALRGAAASIGRFEVMILEVSIIRIGDVPLFHEVIEFMEEAGLRLYDVIPQYYRPLDGALWQADAFFVRRDSSLVLSRAWDHTQTVK